MSVLQLVQVRPDNSRQVGVLRGTASSVEHFGEETQRIVVDLVETMMSHKIAVGLAAPQVGLAIKMAAINITRQPEDTIVICNPVIVSATGKKDKKLESCMSVPGYGGTVERREKVEISYQDATGESRVLKASGFLARVLQHEVDHLNGILYLDRIVTGEQPRKVDLFDRDQ